MRTNPWTRLRTPVTAGWLLSVAVVLPGCGGGDDPERPKPAPARTVPAAPAHHSTSGSGGTRLVLIYDPTAYLHADSGVADEEMFEPLRAFIGKLPRNTAVDFYVVAHDGLNRPPDVEKVLAFIAREPSDRSHKQRAKALGDTLAAVGMARWAEARQRMRQPASCILSTLRRARISLERAAVANERVAFVLVSDLLEVCDDFGQINLEKAIPDSFTLLPDRVELSGVDAIHIVEVDHPNVTDVSATTRLDSVWVRLARSWGAPSERIAVRSTYPEVLVKPAASR